MHIFSTPLIVAAIIVMVVAIAGALLRPSGRAAKPPGSAPAYEAVPALLTAAERSFFGVLQQALAYEYQILAKVRLADIVRPVRRPGRSGWQSAFNRIAGKHVDFVLCDSESLGIVAVVELDDSTHGRFERGFRDSLVDAALADAGIPVLRVSARQDYSPAQIREQVQSLFRSDGRVTKKAA
jgi:pimeloyl-ACP methyl ester carboxylesterase